MQWFRPLQTPGYKIHSSEASDVQDTVMCFLSYVFHVPSFSKTNDFAVSSEIIMVFSLGIHYLQGYIFLFTFQLPLPFTLLLHLFVGVLREHGKQTNKSFPRPKIGVSRASYCQAPIQIKPNRVKALSLCGIIVK